MSRDCFFLRVLLLFRFGLLTLCLNVFVWQTASLKAEETNGDRIDYVRDIRPLLSDNCYACHGPSAEDREGELRLDQKESALGEAASGEHAIVLNKPEESELLRRILSHDEDEVMPPADSGKSLTPADMELIKKWIQQGAAWQDHWSFILPTRTEMPKVKQQDWPRNPIDTLILERLEQENLQPSPAAPKETILRRLTFDLTGLPPTLEEIDAFLADSSPEAYERAVDRLLNSPHYGEHQARFWLDAARYGDTHGLHLDNYREIWPYRDWVVSAFNKNMPFDQFTIEQLAGDLLPDATLDQRVATGFCRCNVSTNEGGSIVEEVYVRNVIDRVTTTGTVFLGLTMECTRCHDHKFDPLTMHDFYSMFAFFNSIDGSAMDGNVKDTQPSEFVPTPKQTKILANTSKQIAELQTKQKSRSEGMEPEFQQWLTELRSQQSSDNSIADFSSTEGLIGHYSFDHLSDGKVQNHAEAESFGKTLGNPKSVAGRYGQGVEITPKAYVDLGDVFDVQHDKKFSFGIWVRLPKEKSGTILSKTTTAERGYALSVDKGQVTVLLTSRKDGYGIHLVSASNVLTPDTWHHVFVTYDASAKAAGVALFVDGERQSLVIKQDSLTGKDALHSINSGEAHLLIGHHESQPPLEGGQVDDFRFYSRDLSQTEVVGVMLAEGMKKLLAQTPKETTPEQLQELREFYFYQVDPVYADLVTQEDKLRHQKAEINSSLPVSLVYRELKEPREAFMLTRGEYDQKGEKVERATPAVLPSFPENAPKNRLGLAQWLVDPQNPLTARVTVNRFWSQFFGTGIVKTAEDFGSQGEVPSHPALLDWLAVEFIETGWDVKSLMKKIVMSNTYRQASNMTPELVEFDPGNRLLAHGPRYRLDAEMLRDQALSVSGLLVNKMGGPSVRPPQPDGLWFSVGYSGSDTVRFVPDTKPEQVHRRTLYTFLKRTSPPPQMSTFDAPSREACVVRRERTNTPLQALLMLNDPQYVEAARALAERVLSSKNSSTDIRLQTMLRLCTGKQPNQATLDVLRRLLHDQLEKFQNNLDAAQALIHVGQPLSLEPSDECELAAWTMLANVVLNLDEVITKN